jgi:hypothetical protein
MRRLEVNDKPFLTAKRRRHTISSETVDAQIHHGDGRQVRYLFFAFDSAFQDDK